ncbi:TRAP transporter small permease [Hoeflea poritis]|uniref:TRAP transporter small permease protein n=1 Tax=Hoeflea poritis TaxID=2993659 RepID=A0ABT4VRC0_9HYPH|nr:TRAP transporter small permease [Hoeflea poritis]MDA4847249.1 TRAP transporter small permease [Hoeflea poritis]
MHSVNRLAEFLARLQLALAALAVLAILLTVSVDVLLRASVNAPIGATIEIVSFYYMIPLVFFPIMTLELKGGHIDTDLFYRLFPRRMKQLSIVVSVLLTALIYLVLAYFTFKQAVVSTDNGEVSMGISHLPIWPVRWVLPFVFATSAVAAFLLCVKRFQDRDRDV